MAVDNLFHCNSQADCGESSIQCKDVGGHFIVRLSKNEGGTWMLSINREGNDYNELQVEDEAEALSTLKRWKENGLIGKRQFMLGLGDDSALYEVGLIKKSLNNLYQCKNV